jgi:hypothetical protein
MKTTPHVLHVLAYDGKPSLTHLSLDKKHDRAQLLKLGLFSPKLRTIPSLSLITDVLATKREEIEDQPEYGIVLRIHDSHPIRFGCASRSQAMEVMRRTAHYLGLHHRRNEIATSANR